MDNYTEKNIGNEPAGSANQGAVSAPEKPVAPAAHGAPQGTGYAAQGAPRGYAAGQMPPGSGYVYRTPTQPAWASAAVTQKKMEGWKVALIVILIVLFVVGLAGYGCSRAVNSAFGNLNSFSSYSGTVQETYSYNHDYLAVVYLNGTIASGTSGAYSHSWMLSRIEALTYDDHNKALILDVNTPGGSTYATLEVYEALMKYRETGKPIYVYMENQATSGGYYVSMAADKIYANVECWTGSIGVIIGTLYDLSGLMERYGVKAYNITSGANKDMGTEVKPLTEEQYAILQSLVDESFDRFVDVVVKGRNMSEEEVRRLADGRIYSATQATENGLIDGTGTLEGTIALTIKDNKLDEKLAVHHMRYIPETSLLAMLGFDSQLGGKNEIESLMEFLEKASTVTVQYMAPIQKEE